MANKWRLVVYFDGVTPTDGMSKKVDKRALEVIYWTFLEFQPYLYMEELWFECTVLRKVTAKKIPAGMSFVVREV